MATRGRNFETFYWKCSQRLLYSSNSFYLVFAICLPQQFLQNINNQLIEFNATGTQYRIIFLTKYWFKIIRDWIKGKYRSRQFFLPRIPTNDNSTTRIYENNKITSLFRHPRSNTEFVYHRTSRIPEFIEIIYSTSRVIHSLLAPIRIPTRPITRIFY